MKQNILDRDSQYLEHANVLAAVKAKPSVAAEKRQTLTTAARDGAVSRWLGRKNGLR